MKRASLSISAVLAAVIIVGVLAVWSGADFSALVQKSFWVVQNGSGPSQLAESEQDTSEQPPVSAPEKNPESPVEVPAPAPSAFSFAIIGDTQRYDPHRVSGGLQQAVRNITAKNVAFLVTEGDLLSSCGEGCAEKLATWKKTLGPLAAKTYTLMGNHDRTGRSSSDTAWRAAFDLPTNGPEGYSELVYSFDFQNTHFVVLNSEKSKASTIDPVQRDWLERDLIANKKVNTFIFFHEPAYPVSSKIDSSLDAHPDERDALWNIFTKYGVTAVFNGHEHIHSRKKIGGIYQFVFGNTDSYDHDLPAPGLADYSYQGSAYGIVDVDGRQITVNLYAVDGRLLNTFRFGP